MIFNLSHTIEQQKAIERLKWLISKGKRVEIKELRGKRTTPQNAYLHLLLNYFAIEVGETMDFIKEHVFKEIVNKELFKSVRVNPKSGKKRDTWKSSKDLDTKEMTLSIERFKDWSVKTTGVRLPDANEQEFLDHIQNEIDKNKQYL